MFTLKEKLRDSKTTIRTCIYITAVGHAKKNVRLALTHSTPLNFFLEEGRGRPPKEQRG